MAPLYTREPPIPRNFLRRTIVQLRRPSPQPPLTCNRLEPQKSRRGDWSWRYGTTAKSEIRGQYVDLLGHQPVVGQRRRPQVPGGDDTREEPSAERAAHLLPHDEPALGASGREDRGEIRPCSEALRRIAPRHAGAVRVDCGHDPARPPHVDVRRAGIADPDTRTHVPHRPMGRGRPPRGGLDGVQEYRWCDRGDVPRLRREPVPVRRLRVAFAGVRGGPIRVAHGRNAADRDPLCWGLRSGRGAHRQVDQGGVAPTSGRQCHVAPDRHHGGADCGGTTCRQSPAKSPNGADPTSPRRSRPRPCRSSCCWTSCASSLALSCRLGRSRRRERPRGGPRGL